MNCKLQRIEVSQPHFDGFVWSDACDPSYHGIHHHEITTCGIEYVWIHLFRRSEGQIWLMKQTFVNPYNPWTKPTCSFKFVRFLTSQLIHLKHIYNPPFNQRTPGWWFQRFFIFTHIWGRFPFWQILFQMGWNHQPDTSAIHPKRLDLNPYFTRWQDRPHWITRPWLVHQTSHRLAPVALELPYHFFHQNPSTSTLRLSLKPKIPLVFFFHRKGGPRKRSYTLEFLIGISRVK